ncbi:MAG: tRNA (adenosine(37)-N6)-threonylcarbamoyltransferase complex transferase subunit TsaD [Melioribacteraceae bacterium]|nr:tRNA (adenosine(37)-N6)-threonylcarbamoyltransferase complex transferase subunit TsaD [Melioribacteraceae bacterium]
MNVLGLESSCDETSVSIIADDVIKSNLISSQDFHIKYGGVVPELSSRAHLQIINPLLKQSLQEANLSLKDIDLVCATAGPGLIGALLIGLTYGKALAYGMGKPFIPVDHVEGHLFSGFLMEEKPEYPFLSLTVSGGHTLLLLVSSPTDIKKLGTTIDDAVGEAFDKVSKMLGYGYPGGPKIQEAASKHLGDLIPFPISNTKGEYDFSFSGIKTAVLRYIQKNFDTAEKLEEEDKNLISASFQNYAVKALIQKVEKAVKNFSVKSLSLSGGVAANIFLREELSLLAKRNNKKLIIPAIQFCGDNAAMIAFRGEMLYKEGLSFSNELNAYPSLTFNKLIR